MSPKRSIFSLNLNDSGTTSHQHVSANKDTTNLDDGVKVFDTKGAKGFERGFGKLVNRVVDDVLEDSGKKVTSVEGDLYSTSTRTKTRESSSTLQVRDSRRRKKLEEKYDTSEL